MHTRNGLPDRLLDAVAIRPAAPGLLAVVVLLILAASGATLVPAAWVWPAGAAGLVITVLLNTVRQDLARRVAGLRHQQRMSTANALLNDTRLSENRTTGPDDELFGSLRELGGLVERVGRRLDDLLAEVHAENRAGQKARRS